MKGAYYVLVMPDEWGAFMTFSKTVAWQDLGIDKEGSTHVCSRVLAMGSSSAVALFQHIHRKTGLSRGIAAHRELRRDARTLFEFQDLNCSWCQYFLDDADCPKLCPAEEVANHLGLPSEMQLLQRKAAQEAGLSYSDEKAVEGELIVERMGALVEGQVGRVSVPENVLANVIIFAFWVLSCSWIFWRTWLMLLGRLSRIFEFRRPLSSTLIRVWKFLGTEGGRPPNREVRAEILVALSSLHLAFTDFRAKKSCREEVHAFLQDLVKKVPQLCQRMQASNLMDQVWNTAK